MKRLVSMLLVFSMLLCMPVGFADAFDELFDLSNDPMRSCIMTSNISFKLDNTLEFLEAVKIPYMEFIDTYHLTKAIFDTSSTINAQIISDESYDRFDAYIELILDAPLQINDDFKVNVWNRFSMWIKYDVSDKENPVFSYIMKIPYDNKYLTFDLADMDTAEAEAVLEGMDIEKTQEQSKEILRKYSVTEKTDDGYIMTISKENCSKYIMEVLKLSGESNTDETAKEVYDAMLVEVENYMNETGIFGDGGIVAEYKVENNSIISTEEAVSISLTVPFIDPDTFEVTTEKINFTVKSSSSYVTPEEGFIIEFPEITEENSTSISNIGNDYGYIPQDYLSIYYEGVGYSTETNTYIPLNNLMAELQVIYEDIVYDDNNITITSDNDYTGFNTLSFSTESESVVKDGEAFSVPNGAIKYNDSIWISEEFLNKVLGIKINYIQYSYGETVDFVSTWVSMTRDSLLVEDEFIDDYISPEISIYSNDTAVLFKNTHYFEFETLMKNCGAAEVNVLGNAETALSADSVVPYASISVYGGSNTVTADDTNIIMDNIVLRLNGKLYVPAEFIYDVLNFRIDSVYNNGSYRLTYDNPEFVYDDYESDYFWVSEYDLPYFNGEVFIPFDAFKLHSNLDVSDSAPSVEYNGKKYITQGYITESFGFKLINVYSYFNTEENAFFTEYSFEKAE